MSDLVSCDVHLSLFVAACSSYKSDSLVRPFPPMFSQGGAGSERRVEELQKCLETIPSLKQLRNVDQMEALSEECLRLLHWLLAGSLHLTSLGKQEAAGVLDRVMEGQQGKVARPAFILEVESSQSERFREMVGGDETDLAFHGSRLDNFYSILSSGLQQHRNKVSLFGEGIYLSEELAVSLPYSTQGVAWQNSQLGWEGA